MWTRLDLSCARGGGSRPVWSHLGTAQEPRTRPQDRPREAQDSPTRPQKASRGAQTRQGALSKRFWTPWDLEKPQKVLYCRRFSWFSQYRKGAFNRGPKSSKRSPPGGPNEPQARPGRPQERPKSPQDGSKSCPEREAPKTTQERPRRGPKGPQAAQTPPGSPSGAHFGLILGPLELHFRAF